MNVTIDNTPNVTLVSPANNTGLNGSSITFVSRNGNAQSSNCTIEVYNSSGGNIKSYAETSVSANGTMTSQSFNSSSYLDGIYFWNATCSDNAGTGISQTYKIIIDRIVPSSITLNYPSNATNITTSNVTFNWTAIDATSDPLICEILIDGNVKFSNISSASNVATTSTQNLTAANITLGSHTWSIACKDSANNTNTSSSRVMAFDTDIMSVTITSPTSGIPATVTVGNSFTTAFQYTEGRPINATVEIISGSSVIKTEYITNLSGGTSTTGSVSINTAGMSAGTYDMKITLRGLNSTDAIINATNTQSNALVLQAASNGSSGSSGSSGSGTSTTPSTASMTFDTMLVSIANTWNVNVDAPVYFISVTPSTTATNVKITVSKVTTTSLEAPSAKTYKYVEISLQNLVNSNINVSKIRFSVEKSWLTNNSMNEDTITMGRWTGTSWQKLDTSKIGSAATTVTYEATTTAFSMFAIWAQVPTTSQSNATQETTQSPSTIDGTGCADECAQGVLRCIGNVSTEVCGNFDTDSCFEWGNTTVCTENTTCVDGRCAYPQNLTQNTTSTQAPITSSEYLLPVVAIIVVGFVVLVSYKYLKKRTPPPSFTPRRRIISKKI
jgi:PGF-pre-PGF domain-containing protein